MGPHSLAEIAGQVPVSPSDLLKQVGTTKSNVTERVDPTAQPSTYECGLSPQGKNRCGDVWVPGLMYRNFLKRLSDVLEIIRRAFIGKIRWREPKFGNQFHEPS